MARARRVLDLFDTVYFRFREVVVKRIAVVKFWVDSGSGNIRGFLESR